MDKVEKSKTAEPKTATTPKSPPASEQPAVKEPVFSLERFKARLFSDIRHYAEYVRRCDLRARRRVYR